MSGRMAIGAGLPVFHAISAWRPSERAMNCGAFKKP
jgi:hypothetical protein